jgi:acyl dehydratase
MTSSFELDLDGGAEVLKELVADDIAALAQRIAADAGGTVRLYTTDRAAAAVTVPAEAQAKHGALTRAASAAGLELRPARAKKPRKPRKAPQ